MLVRQYRAAVDALVLEIPAGTCDVEGEAPEDDGPARAGRGGRAARRRTGSCSSARWNTPGFCDQHTLIYLATGLSSVPEPARRAWRRAT